MEILSLLTASYLYILCQALDLRALQHELQQGMKDIVKDQLTTYFGGHLFVSQLDELFGAVWTAVNHSLEGTSTMDASPRMRKVAAASTTPIVDFCVSHGAVGALSAVPEFREQVAERSTSLLCKLRKAYLSGERGAAPASAFLGRTRAVYEFVRVTLGVRMHGAENLDMFAAGPGVLEATIGQNIALVHEVCTPDYWASPWCADDVLFSLPGHSRWQDAEYRCWPVRVRCSFWLLLRT